MVNPRKKELVAELQEYFKNADTVFVTHYQGLSVTQIKELRVSLAQDGDYVVSKNTLAKIASKELAERISQETLEEFNNQLNGPTALVFVHGEAVNAAKALVKFAKDNEALVLRFGLVDGELVDESYIKTLATMESREVLLAKAAGGMKAGIAKAAYVITALPQKMAQLAGALQEKK